MAADAMMSGGDGQPETLGGVTVTLGGEHAMGESAETDMNGGFAFTGLRAGTYTVTISGFPEDVSFETVSMDVEVEVGDVGNADFTGHFIRTSAVGGQVIIEGEGLAAVTVTLAGGPADESYTTMTDAEGMYSFAELRPGDYTVSISDFDTRDFEFASTSQDVSVDLDETETRDFTGVLLRTSGIAGRVSVEGMGLGDVTVTLSGADDRTAMTDASGQYAFAGLAAGDYMVSIAVESNAYVFDAMSMDVTVGDDESKIVNFEGAHARTSSVSGMLYVDEATKNDMHDEGEDGFPSAAVLQALQAAGVQLPPVLPVPITLHGPGVNEMQSGSLNLATGQFSFGMLRAGSYELRVGSLASVLSALPAEAAAVLRDFEYGGPAAGYPLTVGVGEAVTQNVPVDITHTTVHFAVHLRHGDDMGDALSGATVGFYSDKAGGDQVAMGKTGETGMAMIRFARAGTTGNMVYAGVTAPDGFDVAGDMQMVAWDPKSPMSAAANSQDVVNLKAEFSFAGATVTTAMGGGKALAGWGIDVLMMGDDGMEAVEGAPEMLDDDGMASITLTAESAADLPMTYYVALDADQDDELDGGENYETTDTLPAMLTGLSTSTEMDAGTLEARYTTQTLKVYVHQENDQIEGYTGNVLGGDERMSEVVGVTIRHVSSTNRRATFDPKVWKDVRSGSGRTVWDVNGVVTFRGVPTDHNVFVLADEPDGQNVMVLYPDNLDAFQNADENGIMGSAFGPEGGFGHTVELCPLTSAEHRQDGAKCSSFAFVNTYGVEGEVSKNQIAMKGTDFAKATDTGEDLIASVHVPGTTVTMGPVDGQNLAGESRSFTAGTSNIRSGSSAKFSARRDEDDDRIALDERREFAWGQLAAGVYAVGVPDGWVASTKKQFRLGDEDVAGFNADDDVVALEIDVTPSTGTLYGVVTDGNRPVKDVTVTVNGASDVTDRHGRYIVDGYDKIRSRATSSGSELYLSVAKEGYKTRENNPNHTTANSRFKIERANGGGRQQFAANQPKRWDITLSGSDKVAMVTGTVTDASGDPVEDVEIRVDEKVPNNPNARNSDNERILVTGEDGTYEAEIIVTDEVDEYTISAHADDLYFVPETRKVNLSTGDTRPVNFQAFEMAEVYGWVEDGEGNGLGGITVHAQERGNDDREPVPATTTSRGFFSLTLRGDENYEIVVDPEKESNYTFQHPENRESNGDGRIYVGPGDEVEYGTITAMTVGAGAVKAERITTVTDGDDGTAADPETYTGAVKVTWTTDDTVGVTFTVEAETDDDDSWDDLTTGTVAGADAAGGHTFEGVPVDGEFKVRVRATKTGEDPTTVQGIVKQGMVEAADPSAKITKAERDENNLSVTFTAKTNGNSQHRIAIRVNGTWYLAGSNGTLDDRVWTLDVTGVSGDWIGADDSADKRAVSQADLEKEIMVRIEARQDTVDEEDGDNVWLESRRSAPMTIKGKS